MVQISPEFMKTIDEAKAARDERAKLEASVAELTRSHGEASAERRASLEIVSNCEKQLAGGNKTDVMVRLATARSAVTRAEQTMGEIERKLAELNDRSTALDDALDAIAATVETDYSRFRAGAQAELQEQMAADVAPIVAGHLKRAFALQPLGVFSSAGDAVLPAFDRNDRPLIKNGRLRTGGPDDTTRINLAESWRDDAQLVAEHDAVEEVVTIATAMRKERDRIARERQARIEANPALKEEQMREYRDRCAREAADSIAANEEARKRRERAEAERQAGIDEHRRRRGDQLYPPGHAYGPQVAPKPADMAGPVAGAMAQAERTATGAA